MHRFSNKTEGGGGARRKLSELDFAKVIKLADK